MPRGVYDRKARYQPEDGPKPDAPSGGSSMRPPSLTSIDPMWDAFEDCRGRIGMLGHAQRRAVIGALAGWFNDGKYD